MGNLFAKVGKEKVRVGQIYVNTKNSMQIEIFGKAKKDKWKTRVLTSKPKVYAGTHSLSNKTLRDQYRLMP